MKKRIVNKDLLKYIRTLPCICCTAIPSDAHHVKTVKSGGNDEASNVMPICRAHHQEWHKSGPGHMIKKYKAIEHWLKLAKRDDVLKRVKRCASKR